MKRKTALLMSVLLLISAISINFAGAEETILPTNEEVKTSDATIEHMELTLENVVNLVKENSREMWKIDDGLKQMQQMRKQGRSAKEQAEALMGMPLEYLSVIGVDASQNYIETLMAKNGYYITYADTQTKQLEKNKLLLDIGLEIEAKSLYYSVLAAEKTVEINEAKLNKSKEQLRVINLKFNNGSVTKAEVLNGEMAVQQAQTDLDSSLDDLEMAKLNLLNKTNLPYDTNIVLTDNNLEYIPTSDIDLNEYIQRAKTDRPEILAAQNNLELQKIETHVHKAYYTSNLRQYKAAEEKLKDAELNVPQAYKDVELDVRKSYLNLLKAERALLNMDKTVELAREAARINKLLYENGMVSSLDVLDANTNLAQAEIGRYQLLVAYNISKLMFDNSNLIGSMAK